MNLSDIWTTILIFLIFFILILSITFSLGLKNIEQDWPKYRCNPAVMPFASYFGHDTSENFTYCTQNIQTNYMPFLLEPIHYVLNLTNHIGAQLGKGINDARNMFSVLRSFFSSIFQKIFQIFHNIIIQFQLITIKMRDIVGKFVGTIVSLLYILDGSVKTTQSLWNGPAGAMIRAL